MSWSRTRTTWSRSATIFARSDWCATTCASRRGLPISTRLLCDAHRLLLDGARGAGKQPGELRRSQNWIGGTRPGNAVFVPPPPDRVPTLLAELERFVHRKAPTLPPLVRVALIHAQFETIHPFLDGNGRIGRLLIMALMEDWKLLPEPLMYLSGTLKRHQDEYYRRLSAVRTRGDWEGLDRVLPRKRRNGGHRGGARHHGHRHADRWRPAPSARGAARRRDEPAPVRVAADDAALHDRAGPREARHERPDCHGGGQVAGRTRRRDRTDRTEEETVGSATAPTSTS